jgi:transcriptional regulator with XRE-family HTH domain
MNYLAFKGRLMKNPKFRKEYQRKDLAFEISQMLLDARIKRGMSQQKLARLIRTKQSSIARIESGSTLPSLTFLLKIAKALKYELSVLFRQYPR